MAATGSIKVVMNAKLASVVTSHMNRIIGETVRQLRDEIRQELSTPFPPSSKPGNPPHMRSGSTQKSIKTKKLGNANWMVYAQKQESDKENLAIWLELGTGAYRKPFPNDSKGSITGRYSSPGNGRSSMHARPFMLTTFNRRVGSILRSKFTMLK